MKPAGSRLHDWAPSHALLGQVHTDSVVSPDRGRKNTKAKLHKARAQEYEASIILLILFIAFLTDVLCQLYHSQVLASSLSLYMEVYELLPVYFFNMEVKLAFPPSGLLCLTSTQFRREF